MRSVAFSCIVLLALVPFIVADDEKDVVVLTNDNFQQFINQDIALVEFYAPWCGHCKQLAPEYAKAATELLDNDPPVPLGKVDATVYGELATPYEVRGYPTLKVFRNGKPSDYNGGRTKDTIISYMKKQTGPAARPITVQKDIDALRKIEPDVDYVVIGFFTTKQTQLQTSFTLVANKFRDNFAFGKAVDAAELAAKYGVKGDEGIVVILKGEPKVYSGKSKQSEVEEFIKSNSLPLIGEYTDNNAQLYFKRELPIGKLYMTVDRNPKSKTMKYIVNRLQKIAEKYKNEIIIAYADKNKQQRAIEHFNLQDDEYGFTIEEPKGDKQYKWESDDDEDNKKKKGNALNIKSITEFVDSYFEGAATPYVKSQKAPKKNNGPVKIVVGTNFDDIVNDDDKDVMLEFYAPWCGHCKQLEPKYNELGQKFKKNKDVVVAKIDATANDYDRQKWSVSGYPTIFFKPAGGSPKLYEGGRDVEDMYQYIMKNGKKAKKGKNSKKKNKKKKKSKSEDDDE